MNRLEKQMDFILEVDKLKTIYRQSHIADGSRKENDAEHSWHMALMCMILWEYSNEEVDVLKIMKMLIIHDLVEIDAGDTYAYDESGNETKLDRELEAAERIFNLLPDEQAKEMRGLWDEFEEGKTPEAKFAATLDRIQPLLLNHAADGKSWREHGVYLSQIIKRNKVTPQGSEKLWEYGYNLIMDNVEKGNILKED